MTPIDNNLFRAIVLVSKQQPIQLPLQGTGLRRKEPSARDIL